MAEKAIVVVDGDIDILWRFARARALKSTGQRRDREYQLKCSKEAGGAALLGKLLAKVATVPAGQSVEPGYVVRDPPLHEFEKIRPGDVPYWHKYDVCEGLRTRKNVDAKEVAWRVKNPLGVYEAIPANGGSNARQRFQYGDDADIIVIEDSNTGFRSAQELWEESLAQNKGASIILKSAFIDFARPENKLWRYVRENFKDRIILVFTVRDLRFMGLQISRGLSWERTVSEVVREFRRIWNQDQFQFGICTHVVISFFTAGALVLTHSAEADFTAKLYYDPRYMEDEWSDLCEGSVAGNTLCLTAAIVVDMVRSPRDSARGIGRGIVAGVVAARKLLLHGYATGVEGVVTLPETLLFPVAVVSDALSETLLGDSSSNEGRSCMPWIDGATLENDGYIANSEIQSRILECAIPSFHEQDDWNCWTILKDKYPSDKPDSTLEKARELAVGPQPNNVSTVDYEDWASPITSFAAWASVDRAEIEAARAIGTLIGNYVGSEASSKPLSLAVFGRPGSGKSFAVTQVAEAVAGSSRPVKSITFNLSQFTTPQAIIDGLHQVRDIGLSGCTPLVFWDEFDTSFGGAELGWLRYFLAPMQDGRFQEGPVTHSIGRAIFVFAGGNFKTFQEFEQRARPTDRSDSSTPSSDVKGPDFLSRLQGYLDIKSLDYEGDIETKSEIDAAVAFRRAMLLRDILKRSKRGLERIVSPAAGKGFSERLNVDRGVVDAFLKIGSYKYGVRSMEAIVKMSAWSQRNGFDRSALAPKSQLEMHLNDAEKFLAIIRSQTEVV